jgi:hypothetical protein
VEIRQGEVANSKGAQCRLLSRMGTGGRTARAHAVRRLDDLLDYKRRARLPGLCRDPLPFIAPSIAGKRVVAYSVHGHPSICIEQMIDLDGRRDPCLTLLYGYSTASFIESLTRLVLRCCVQVNTSVLTGYFPVTGFAN